MLRSWAALLVAVATATAGGLVVSAAEAGPAQATSNKIGFYSDLASSINGPGVHRPLVRPSLILLTEDGSVVLAHLRWTSWGGRITHARGVFSAGNCKPNCAQGARTNSPARLTLSSRGRVLGHRVYRCYQLRVPSHPKVDQHECLKRKGKLIVYWPVSAPSRSLVHVAGFLSPDRKIWCLLTNDPGDRQAACYSGYGGKSSQHSGQVNAKGKVALCNWTPSQGPNAVCMQNWGFGEPVLQAGAVDVLYRYRCSVAPKSITCMVTTGPGKGKGFVISKQSVKTVG